jgi:hypothetical protein
VNKELPLASLSTGLDAGAEDELVSKSMICKVDGGMKNVPGAETKLASGAGATEAAFDEAGCWTV